ncbi:hypothetical protein BU16DRAFT_566808 [Lophium mytilinum]|uniref:Uncharacterized protein n=1 Tax=Lophium mytilinum TaxID=390894 RepID=A0A6A6QC89_9PEZI|nr:hypothetical protein BU16DRAFT_566808 [Lophium mytilinum]
MCWAIRYTLPRHDYDAQQPCYSDGTFYMIFLCTQNVEMQMSRKLGNVLSGGLSNPFVLIFPNRGNEDINHPKFADWDIENCVRFELVKDNTGNPISPQIQCCPLCMEKKWGLPQHAPPYLLQLAWNHWEMYNVVKRFWSGDQQQIDGSVSSLSRYESWKRAPRVWDGEKG